MGGCLFQQRHARCSCSPSSRGDASVTAEGRIANQAPRRCRPASSCLMMSKRADGAPATRDDEESSSGKNDDVGSSGNREREPSSPMEPSEAFKRPRLASDARKPIQTRAREPRPLWHDHAEETDAPPIAPRRPWRQPRAASPPPEASEAPDATPSEPSEAPTPESNARTLYDTAAASPSPPPPAPTPAPAAPDPGSDANAPGDSPKATPTNAATNAVAQEKSTS